MTMVAAQKPALGVRRARVAVAALFLTNGALFANLVPRYPDIKAELDLSNAAFGSALAGWPQGLLLSGLFAATLINRFTSARAASLGDPAAGGRIPASGRGTGLGGVRCGRLRCRSD